MHSYKVHDVQGSFNHFADEEQEIWLPACFAVPWLIGQQVRQQKQQLHQTKENGRKMKLKKFR